MRRKNEQSATVWKQRHEKYLASGLSRGAFCRRFKLKLSTVDYWFARPRREGRREGLVELKGIGSGPVTASCLTLVMAEGARLEILAGCDMKLLGEVVRLLRSR